jgi:tetratricopeptide (TPR) repeat protein
MTRVKQEDPYTLPGNHEEWQRLMEQGNEAYAERKFARAETSFVDALKIAEAWVDGKDDPATQILSDLTKTLNNTAAIYQSQGKYKLAEDIYDRCLVLKQKLYGEDHLETAIALHNIAVLYSAQQKYFEAEPLYLRALNIREKHLGVNSPELATHLRNYALLLRKLKREEESTKLEARVEKCNQPR